MSSVPLINVCDPLFKTVVTCNTVSSEGYEVTNLLADDLKRRKAGFLCDRFIKPPVEIILRFPFDVCIRYIQIGAEVGQQKSSGIEISSTSVPYNSSLCSASSSIKMFPKPRMDDPVISERIASFVLNDSEKGAIIYCPLHYGRQMLKPVPSLKSDFIQKPMSWKCRSVVAHTSSVTVRIFRTNGSSVPAIGSIEIWGAPSSCMPPNKIIDISNLWKSVSEKQTTHDCLQVEDDNCIVASPDPNDYMLADVPEEFLDAITYEVMALPMVLPSGKVVDQRTLDLHAQAEAKWGRLPSDPFTGIMLREGYRPVLDSALKARIDRFLVLNQDRSDLQTVPRTVGRKRPLVSQQSVPTYSNQASCSSADIIRKQASCSSTNINRKQASCSSADTNRKWSLLSSSAVRNARVLPQVMSNDCVRRCRSQETNVNLDRNSGIKTLPELEEKKFTFSSVAKRTKLNETVLSTKEGGKSIEESDEIICLTESCKYLPLNANKNLIESVRNHEKKLNESLDSALQAALSGLPSFVNPPAPKVSLEQCSSCKISETLYCLPCTHFLCRSCLVKVCKQTPPCCPFCLLAFKSCDPVFHHK